MEGRSSPPTEDTEGRHSPDWYDQSAELVVLVAGDRFFISCDGGPCISRLERFPPRLEIPERDGLYILIDDGPREQWCYEFLRDELDPSNAP